MIRRCAFIILFATVISHALMSLLTGSLDPTRWSGLEFLGTILFIAPSIAVAIAIVSGEFDGPSVTYGARARGNRER